MFKCLMDSGNVLIDKSKRLFKSFLPTLLGHRNLEMESSQLNLDDLYEKNQKKEDYSNLPKILQKPIHKVDDLAAYVAGKNDFSSVLKNARKPMIVGCIVMALFFGVFCVWALLAPLKGAVVARGKIAGTVTNKFIQHLEGGIIKEIFVKEGSMVKKNEPLLKIDDVRIKANLQILNDKMITILLIKERLLLERAGETDFITKKEFLEEIADEEGIKPPEKIDTVVWQNQKKLFDARMGHHLGQIEIMNKRIEELGAEKIALSNQANSLEKQNQLMQEQIDDAKSLVNDGFGNKNMLSNLEIQNYELLSKIGSIQSAISQNEQKTIEAEISILNVKNEYIQRVEGELREIETSVFELDEQIKSTQDTFDRTLVKAPYDGIVSDLKYNVQGAVIAPGSMLMSLVPENDRLIVEANIGPGEISNLIVTNTNLINYRYDENSEQKPIEVKIRLSTFSSRKVPTLYGYLMNVSPDLIQDPRSGYAFYLAKVMITPESMKNLPKDVALYQGMPADVFINTKSKTFFAYLLSPITASFDRAFLES